MNPNKKIRDRICEHYFNSIAMRGGDESDDDAPFDLSKSFEKLLEINKKKKENENATIENSKEVSSTCCEFDSDSIETDDQTFNTMPKDASNMDTTNRNHDNNNSVNIIPVTEPKLIFIDLTNDDSQPSDIDANDNDDESVEFVSGDNIEMIGILPNDHEADVNFIPTIEVEVRTLTIPTEINDSVKQMDCTTKPNEQLFKIPIKTPIKSPLKSQIKTANLKKTTQSQISRSNLLKIYNLFDEQKKTPTSLEKHSSQFLTASNVTHNKPLKKSKFSHIKSPVAAYINNRQTTMIQNVHQISLKFSPEKENNSLDFTILNNENNIVQTNKLPLGSYIQVNNQLITDVRNEVIPGGDKIKSLLAPEPKIFRHFGHMVENEHQIETKNLMDLSIIEIPNVKRY